MRIPNIRIGFIIFNEDWKEELPKENGHRKTAYNWIKNHNMLKLYEKVLGTNGINDEEDFLIEYIGAIKLYANRGNLYCRIPRMCSPEKSYLKRYYASLGYKIISDRVYDEEKPKIKTLTYEYNRTVINKNNILRYNPVRDGD